MQVTMHCISLLVKNRGGSADHHDLHADFPAPDGPMSSIFRVGRESSEAMISNNTR